MKGKQLNQKFVVSEEYKNTVFSQTRSDKGKIANYLIVFLIIISLGVLTFASIDNNANKYLIPIYIINFIINSLFLLEYLYRWYNSENKLKFPFTFLNILFLISFLPFFVLSIIYGVGIYSIFSIFRIFTLLISFELIERNPYLSKAINGIRDQKREYYSVIGIFLIILFFFATLMYFIEFKVGLNSNFSSIPRSLLWGVDTMIGKGYLGIVPETSIGKIIETLLMILGSVTLGLLVSITILILLKLNGTENTVNRK